MARHHNPTLTTSGLILCLDVNNSRGYDQGTPSLTDLTKRDTTVTFYNSPAASSTYINFDGANDFIRITRSDLNAGSFQPDYITVCMWIWIDPTTPLNGANNIFTCETSWEVAIHRRNATHANVLYASNPWAWRGNNSAVIPVGQWNLITFVHGATTVKMYVNDVLNHSQAHSGPLGAGNGSWPYITLGGRYTGTTSRTKGRMGSFMIYDRELSEEEIFRNFYARRGKYNV